MSISTLISIALKGEGRRLYLERTTPHDVDMYCIVLGQFEMSKKKSLRILSAFAKMEKELKEIIGEEV